MINLIGYAIPIVVLIIGAYLLGRGAHFVKHNWSRSTWVLVVFAAIVVVLLIAASAANN